MLENIFEGASCLATVDNIYWSWAKIFRINEDNTFTIGFDDETSHLVPYWYGVTLDQISVDDRQLWSKIFKKLTNNSLEITQPIFADALHSLGYQFNKEQFRAFYTKQCQNILKIETSNVENTDFILNEEQAYQLLLNIRCSAKR